MATFSEWQLTRLHSSPVRLTNKLWNWYSDGGPALTKDDSVSIGIICRSLEEWTLTPSPAATISFLSVQGFLFLTRAIVSWGSSLCAAISWLRDRAEPEDKDPVPANTHSTSDPGNAADKMALKDFYEITSLSP
jgi:hypothetical protein